MLASQILRLPDLRLRTPYHILPRPNAIDQWFLANRIDISNKVFNQSHSYMGDVPSDQMSCTLQLSAIIKHKYRHHDMFTYRLILYANVPETSGIDVTYMSSPVVTLSRYDGHYNDSNAPGWTRLPMGVIVELRQPSAAVADVFAELAFWPENAYIPTLSKTMLDWSSAVSSVIHLEHLAVQSNDEPPEKTETAGVRRSRGAGEQPIGWVSVSD